MSDGDLIYVNGVNGVTGEYSVPPLTIAEAAAQATRIRLSRERREELELLANLLEGHLGWGVPLESPSKAGWGVVIRADEPEDVQLAVRRLFDHRAREVPAKVLHWLSYPSGGEMQDHRRWLENLGVGAGASDPRIVPHYLLVVGSPDRISYEFTQGLSVEHAVGRLDFPTADGYKAYVDSLIAYERPNLKPVTARRITFFAPSHELLDNDITRASVRHLVRPLAGLDPSPDADPGVAEEAGWTDKAIYLVDDATKDALHAILHPPAGELPGAVLFTASHGMVFPKGHEAQTAWQGALLCQDWPGLTKIHEDYYFGAKNLQETARLHGLIAFCFACFGGGTPTHDHYLQVKGQEHELADRAFTAALPQAMLAHPNGGALACISHVDRAWSTAFHKGHVKTQIGPFRIALTRILEGHPVGYAMRFFADKYATLSADIASKQSRVVNRLPGAEEDLTWTWVERNDAESYVILGDPAARLRPQDMAG